MPETEVPHPPVLIDNAEAYEKRFNIIYGRLATAEDFLAKLPEYTEGQREIVELEAKMFGVNPDTNPQGFVDAHARFVTETEAGLQEILPRVKDDVVKRVANYFAGNDEAKKAGLIDMMRRRLASTKEVGVYDSLSTNIDSAGFFNQMARQPHLVISELVLAIESSESPEDYNEKIEKVVLAHEVMHGILTSGTQATGWHNYSSIRNGLAVDIHTNPSCFMEDETIRHGQWLNEAMLESFRRDIFKTEDVRYEPGVILLETLDELSPGLRDELVMTSLGAQGPGPVFGKVEMLLGPTGIEGVEELLTKVKRFEDFSDYKVAVIGMLPIDLQAKASEIFNKKEIEVFGNREWYKAKMAKSEIPKNINFPEKDRLNDQGELPTPEELGVKAKIDAELLALQPELNFCAIEMHMRALVGILNKMDEQTFNRLPKGARDAVLRTYSTAQGYFSSLGLGQEVIDEFNTTAPDGITDYKATRIVLNKMQIHVSIVPKYEEQRKMGEVYRGLAVNAENRADRSLRSQEDVIAEQRSGEFPYDEDGIRAALRSFGDSFGPVITGWHEIAPLNGAQREIVSYALSCLNSACPSATPDTEFSDYI